MGRRGHAGFGRGCDHFNNRRQLMLEELEGRLWQVVMQTDRESSPNVTLVARESREGRPKTVLVAATGTVVHVNTGSNRKVGSESDLLKPRLDNSTLDVVTKTEFIHPTGV